MDISVLFQSRRRLKALATVETSVQAILAFTRFAGVRLALFDLLVMVSSVADHLRSFEHSNERTRVNIQENNNACFQLGLGQHSFSLYNRIITTNQFNLINSLLGTTKNNIGDTHRRGLMNDSSQLIFFVVARFSFSCERNHLSTCRQGDVRLHRWYSSSFLLLHRRRRRLQERERDECKEELSAVLTFLFALKIGTSNENSLIRLVIFVGRCHFFIEMCHRV